MINIKDSYELFMDTLSRLTEENLKFNDIDLTYEIFEELDSDHHTFLHRLTVDRLIDGGLVPGHLSQPISDLREIIQSAINKKNTIEEYRNDPEWQGIRKEGNRIYQEVKMVNENL